MTGKKVEKRVKGFFINVLDEKKLEKIFELKEKGLSNYQIAKQLNAHQHTITKYLEMGCDTALKYVQDVKAKRIKPDEKWKKLVLDDEKAQEWLDSYAKGSSQTHVSAITYYCEFANKSPTELIEEAITEIKSGKLIGERGYFRYLNRYEMMLREHGFSPNTVGHHIAVVRSFYGFHQIFEMPKRGARRDKRAKTLPENKNNKIRKEDIKDMLSMAKYLRDRALILAIASSGLGRAEVISLIVRQFKEGYDPETGICIMPVRRVKTGTDFHSIISKEAADAIWQYLEKEREITRDNIKDHLNEALFAVTKNTHRGGEALKAPLSGVGLNRVFKDIARRLGHSPSLNENGNIIYNKFHPHNLRKFFNTTMKNGGMPEIQVEYLMGHEIGGTQAAYYQEYLDEIKENYLKFMPVVTIQSLKTEVIKSKEYQELKGDNEKLKKELNNLKGRLAQIEGSKKKIEPLLDELTAYPELKEMFDSFLTIFEHKIKILKGEEKEVVMTIDEASEVTEDKWIKITDKG